MKRPLKGSLLASLLMSAWLLGCGSNGSSGTTTPDAGADAKTPPVKTDRFAADSTQLLQDLVKKNSDVQALCDQVNAAQGGYGRSVSCSSGTKKTDTNQGGCMEAMQRIAGYCSTLTVGDVVGCSIATGEDLCKAANETKCSPFSSCGWW